MADPISIVASIIGISSAGIKLSTTLYTYAETAFNADKALVDVARDVSLTSSVLGELGSILDIQESGEGDGNEKRKRKNALSPTALKSAGEAVEGCRKVFGEIEGVVGAMIGGNGKGNGAKTGKTVKMGMAKRLRWPLKEPRIRLLLGNLERLKTTLLLILNVLLYARGNAQMEPNEPSAYDEKKLLIKGLMRKEKASKKTYQELEKALDSQNDPSTQTAPAIQANLATQESKEDGQFEKKSFQSEERPQMDQYFPPLAVNLLTIPPPHQPTCSPSLLPPPPHLISASGGASRVPSERRQARSVPLESLDEDVASEDSDDSNYTQGHLSKVELGDCISHIQDLLVIIENARSTLTSDAESLDKRRGGQVLEKYWGTFRALECYFQIHTLIQAATGLAIRKGLNATYSRLYDERVRLVEQITDLRVRDMIEDHFKQVRVETSSATFVVTSTQETHQFRKEALAGDHILWKPKKFKTYVPSPPPSNSIADSGDVVTRLRSFGTSHQRRERPNLTPEHKVAHSSTPFPRSTASQHSTVTTRVKISRTSRTPSGDIERELRKKLSKFGFKDRLISSILETTPDSSSSESSPVQAPLFGGSEGFSKKQAEYKKLDEALHKRLSVFGFQDNETKKSRRNSRVNDTTHSLIFDERELMRLINGPQSGSDKVLEGQREDRDTDGGVDGDSDVEPSELSPRAPDHRNSVAGAVGDGDESEKGDGDQPDADQRTGKHYPTRLDDVPEESSDDDDGLFSIPLSNTKMVNSSTGAPRLSISDAKRVTFSARRPMSVNMARHKERDEEESDEQEEEDEEEEEDTEDEKSDKDVPVVRFPKSECFHLATPQGSSATRPTLSLHIPGAAPKRVEQPAPASATAPRDSRNYADNSAQVDNIMPLTFADIIAGEGTGIEWSRSSRSAEKENDDPTKPSVDKATGADVDYTKLAHELKRYNFSYSSSDDEVEGETPKKKLETVSGHQIDFSVAAPTQPPPNVEKPKSLSPLRLLPARGKSGTAVSIPEGFDVPPLSRRFFDGVPSQTSQAYAPPYQPPAGHAVSSNLPHAQRYEYIPGGESFGPGVGVGREGSMYTPAKYGGVKEGASKGADSAADAILSPTFVRVGSSMAADEESEGEQMDSEEGEEEDEEDVDELLREWTTLYE
ncbi:hypothetical protein K402DRAFT_177475 [Aulographum hederae CBS 113979]|uniref:Fungal N-terminal domain-containing protein n=1 Tax=Aulographum hederae CBS 113979 TaxID=1176131 RepID=A0A6G1GQV1_9PEZI|nr:hypothetical protein K402DRAFT_177475 [Aulographum hederae CBS 113979]